MKALTALLALIAAAAATPLLAEAPSVWSYNDACEQALRDADYRRAEYRCQAAADLAARIRPGTPEQASALDHLAQLRADQGRYEDAIGLAGQASAITEQSFADVGAQGHVERLMSKADVISDS